MPARQVVANTNEVEAQRSCARTAWTLQGPTQEAGSRGRRIRGGGQTGLPVGVHQATWGAQKNWPSPALPSRAWTWAWLCSLAWGSENCCVGAAAVAAPELGSGSWVSGTCAPGSGGQQCSVTVSGVRRDVRGRTRVRSACPHDPGTDREATCAGAPQESRIRACSASTGGGGGGGAHAQPYTRTHTQTAHRAAQRRRHTGASVRREQMRCTKSTAVPWPWRGAAADGRAPPAAAWSLGATGPSRGACMSTVSSSPCFKQGAVLPSPVSTSCAPPDGGSTTQGGRQSHAGTHRKDRRHTRTHEGEAPPRGPHRTTRHNILLS